MKPEDLSPIDALMALRALTEETQSVFQALRAGGFNPMPIKPGEAELRINDPDDLSQVHDIVDGFMAEVIQYAGSNRITVREVSPK